MKTIFLHLGFFTYLPTSYTKSRYVNRNQRIKKLSFYWSFFCIHVCIVSISKQTEWLYFVVTFFWQQQTLGNFIHFVYNIKYKPFCSPIKHSTNYQKPLSLECTSSFNSVVLSEYIYDITDYGCTWLVGGQASMAWPQVHLCMVGHAVGSEWHYMGIFSCCFN